jgi:hypothetical protein
MEKLSLLEMEEVQGSVGWLEYCRTLVMIALNNDLDAGAQGGWNIGWEANCADRNQERIYRGM